jgi:hypothetical protein
VLTVSKDRPLLTTITGSLPRLQWFVENLKGRPFSLAMTEVGFREQYSDAIAAYWSDAGGSRSFQRRGRALRLRRRRPLLVRLPRRAPHRA